MTAPPSPDPADEPTTYTLPVCGVEARRAAVVDVAECALAPDHDGDHVAADGRHWAPGSLPVGAPDPLSLAPADPVGGRPGEWNATPVTGASDRCFVNLYREGEMILVLSMQRGRVEHHLSRRMMESYNPRDWSIVERPSDRLDGGIIISLEPVLVSEIHASTCGLGPNHPGDCAP